MIKGIESQFHNLKHLSIFPQLLSFSLIDSMNKYIFFKRLKKEVSIYYIELSYHSVKFSVSSIQHVYHQKNKSQETNMLTHVVAHVHWSEYFILFYFLLTATF